MRFYSGDFIEVAIVLIALYGVFCLIKKGWEKFISIDTEKKSNVANSLKIFLIGIILGLLLYVTPFVNETIKILISLFITLGAFVGTFILKESKGYNFNTRIVIFMGQIFFGITMLLLMVNTNLGYSPLSVFAIWTIFNIYIYKQFGKAENVFMLISTSIVCGLLALSTYENTLDISIWITIICVILLGCELFNIREKLVGKGIHNALLTCLLIMAGSINENELALSLFIITFVFLIATIILMLLKKQNINLKSVLIYIPFIVVVLLVGIEDEFCMLISLFNLLVAIWLLAEKSIYKKVLTTFFMIVGVVALLNVTYLDGLFQLIVMASTALTLVYLFEKKSTVKLEKGETGDEE